VKDRISLTALLDLTEFSELEPYFEAASMVTDFRDVRDMSSLHTGELLAAGSFEEDRDFLLRSSLRSSYVKGEDTMAAVSEVEGLRARLYLLVEVPDSSVAASRISVIMAVHIVISVLILFVEPLTIAESDLVSDSPLWRVLEWYFTLVFTTEYCVRLFVADAIGKQTIKQFLTAPSNICDLVAILPFYMELALRSASSQGGAVRLLRVARLMRLSRVMRMARLATRIALAGPVAMVLTVIWGIYLKSMGI